MKKTSFSLFLVGFFAVSVLNLGCEKSEPAEAQEMVLPLINQMSFMQHFSTKLYYAGAEENWELADFYSHELEETAEDVFDANFEHHGHDVSNLIETMLYPAIERVEEAIDAEDVELFKNNYQTLINSCNACHKATGHPYLEMKTPESNPYNQNFSKK